MIKSFTLSMFVKDIPFLIIYCPTKHLTLYFMRILFEQNFNFMKIRKFDFV
jgi:hypothetical protein